MPSILFGFISFMFKISAIDETPPEIINGIFGNKNKLEPVYSKLEIGRFGLEIDDFTKEKKYNISILIDNDNEIDLQSEEFDLHSVSYYNTNIKDANKIYSRLLFDMNSNYSIYGSAYKTSIPLHFPKLNIKINNVIVFFSITFFLAMIHQGFSFHFQLPVQQV